MSRYKGIIFDLDGTLLNTIEDLSDSVNEVLTAYGYPNHNYEEYKLKIGRGFRNLMENSFPKGMDEKTIDEALPLFVEIYDRRYQNKTKPYKGICEIVDTLYRMGIKIGVNSNKRTDYTRQLVSKFFKEISFVEILGERQNVPKKPDPTAALEIVELMELLPQEVLYVGDSKTDIMTARNAGVDSIGVLWGFRSYEELKEHGATYIVSKPQDIIDIVSGSTFYNTLHF